MSRKLTGILLASAACGALSAAFVPAIAPVVFAVALITLSPFARAKRLWFVGDVESEFRIVSRRRAEALRAMKDLDDDKLAGKVTAAEAASLRPALLQAAKDLTTQLDRLQARRAEIRKKIEGELASK
ncbi:MAG: hypothetical protein IT464_02150 [Planctomycetes bacterium]|nr:hypothetical protein [Planctomycetota bacterium]